MFLSCKFREQQLWTIGYGQRFFLLSLCFTKRGEDRVVLSFPPKGTLVERGCYQVVGRKGYQGRVYLVACGFKGVIRLKSLEDMLEDFSLTNFLNLLFGYFVTVFSSNNEQSSDHFFQLFSKFSRMRSKGSRFTLGVWGLGVEGVFARRCVHVRNRPQRSCEDRMAVPMVSSAGGVIFGGFHVSLLRFAWQAWHFVTFRRVL